MAFRLKLVPEETHINWFSVQWLTFGISAVLMVASLVVTLVMGLNFGIDFRGGTTIRAESTQTVDIAQYRKTLDGLQIGDVSITEIFDNAFTQNKNITQIRLAAGEGDAAVTPEELDRVHTALLTIDPTVKFVSVESVGPKVSGELVKTAFYAVTAATIGIMIYIWFRFEWQFAVGAVVSMVHDALLTVGIFALFQIRFDLTTIAALLTVVSYSVNDTVVVFDRLRENLMKYKTTPLIDLMNLTVNETLSRTVMTGMTTAIALTAMLIYGGDVIRSFVFAMLWGVFVGTYSTLYMAKNIVLWLGVKRDWSKDAKKDPTPAEFRDIG
ncbi:protein translocase subunit SecF [Paracoccus aminophilus]|uniref:Protein-export membrane protein SecF n=1 Tax=Paracoccus aminophilus JCM 7686 TaxID=1367847 RepID=S5Y9Q2_PARAH|nr:protein translocase subunit SecF [Paracoccus aminophilus]AGT08063.1 preprotein translocase, subunit SecF [Paracoccus aminophilus JCM 7686]